jgi:hypothetical protein
VKTDFPSQGSSDLPVLHQSVSVTLVTQGGDPGILRSLCGPCGPNAVSHGVDPAQQFSLGQQGGEDAVAPAQPDRTVRVVQAVRIRAGDGDAQTGVQAIKGDEQVRGGDSGSHGGSIRDGGRAVNTDSEVFSRPPPATINAAAPGGVAGGGALGECRGSGGHGLLGGQRRVVHGRRGGVGRLHRTVQAVHDVTHDVLTLVKVCVVQGPAEARRVQQGGEGESLLHGHGDPPHGQAVAPDALPLLGLDGVQDGEQTLGGGCSLGVVELAVGQGGDQGVTGGGDVGDGGVHGGIVWVRVRGVKRGQAVFLQLAALKPRRMPRP